MAKSNMKVYPQHDGWRARDWMGLLLVFALLAMAVPAAAQRPVESSGRVLRVIDDPSTGAHWLLLADGVNPAGPGRMVLIAEPRKLAVRNETGSARVVRAPDSDETPLLPVIRPGDRLIVEESTPVVEARLEAVALGAAVSGSAFNARLRIGGRVVRAVALAPGRAVFAPESEVRP